MRARAVVELLIEALERSKEWIVVRNLEARAPALGATNNESNVSFIKRSSFTSTPAAQFDAHRLHVTV